MFDKGNPGSWLPMDRPIEHRHYFYHELLVNPVSLGDPSLNIRDYPDRLIETNDAIVYIDYGRGGTLDWGDGPPLDMHVTSTYFCSWDGS